MKNNKCMEAMNFRHACKMFETTKKINDEDIQYILELGRKSPSSFGMEPWKFLVITNEALKKELQPFCWNQPQITTSSHLVVILAAIDRVKPQSGVPQKMFARRELPQEKINAYIDLYGNFLHDTFSDEKRTYDWSAKQCYIAAANMMNGAAYIGIDSCPIEGFEKANVEKVLALETQEYQVAMLLPFGYRVNAQPSQIRLAFDEVVTFIK